MIQPAIAVSGITKRYSSTVALDAVTVTIRRGAVTAVTGANGSGKTTLLSILAGIVPPTSGEVAGPGRRPLRGLRDAQECGVVLVSQEPTLAGHLRVWENVSLGRPDAARGPFRADAAARALARRSIAGLLAPDVLEKRTSDLSKSTRQLVQLAGAMAKDPVVLMLDEPTAVLDEGGVEALHALIRSFVGGGGTVVIVSHRIRDVLELADEVVVLRNGRVIDAGRVDAGTEARILRALSTVERPDRPTHLPDLGRAVLRVAGLQGIHGLQIDELVVHAGEIVGIAGQAGSGRSRLASVLAGAYPAEGTVTVDGRALKLGLVTSAQAAGISYIPEDRKETAILGSQSVAANLLLGRRDRHLRWGPFRRRRTEDNLADDLITRFEILPPDRTRPAWLLSGGNQQKVIVGRALSRDAKLVIADEPTQGVDVGARSAIHSALLGAAASGSAIVVVCSEFDELFAISDRIVVMRDGRIVLDEPRGSVSQDQVLAASLGAEPRHLGPNNREREWK